MLDFAWSEIVLIGVVALLAIGPKDMPLAIRTAARAMKKARAMAAELQTHIDDMIRHAELDEVKEHLSGVRDLSLPRLLERAVPPRPALAPPPRHTTMEETLTLMDLRPSRAVCVSTLSRSRGSL